jgi:hypothetical protein
MMRVTTLLALGAGAALLALCAAAPATAGGNRDGYGIYSPAEPPVRGRPRLYRYDRRSWYYSQPRYYPYYASGYWVPRPEMRYRYRYKYIGPQYRYYPAWGYGEGCPARGRCY